MLAQNQIWFSIEDEGIWNHVSIFDLRFCRDLYVFKGKIYTINSNYYHLCELTLNPEPKVTLLKTVIVMNDLDIIYCPQLVSCSENLYVMESFMYGCLFNVYKLDSGKMEWVHFEDTGEEHGFFFSGVGHGAAVKPEFWAEPWSQYQRYDVDNGGGHGRVFPAIDEWYFPHECLNVNLLDESS